MLCKYNTAPSVHAELLNLEDLCMTIAADISKASQVIGEYSFI